MRLTGHSIYALFSMNKRLFILLSFLFCFNLSFGQVWISVTDYETGKPVEGARINFVQPLSEGNALGTWETDRQGLLKLDTTGLNNTHVRIYSPGYAPETRSFIQLRQALFKVTLKASVVNMYEVVVSANRFEERKTDLPRQILTLNQRQIQQLNPQNSADLMQNSGEIFVQRSQAGGGSPVIRGFEANKVLLVLDGIRMNNAIYRGGHLQNILRVDAEAIEKTEVIFGAGSVMYGSDALGGVIHLMTRKPELSHNEKPHFRMHLSGSYASANHFNRVHSDFNIGYRKWASWTSLSLSTFGDTRQGANRPSSLENLGLRDSVQASFNGMDHAVANGDPLIQNPSGFQQTDLIQKFLFRPNQQQSHLFNLQWSTTGNVPRYDRLTEKNTKTGLFNSAEWYYGPETRALASYQLQINPVEFIWDILRITTAYQFIEESRHNRGFNSNRLNHRFEKVHIGSINVDARKKQNRYEWMYGVEMTHNVVQSSAHSEHILTGIKSPLSTRYPDGGSTQSVFAAYLNHAFEWSDQLILTAGIRTSLIRTTARFNDKTFYPFLENSFLQNNRSINGQAGLVFQPNTQWRLSGNLSSGFRAPNVDDLGKIFESAGGDKVIVPNPNLKPEQTLNAEIGVGRFFLNQNLKSEITGWATLLNNALGVAPATLNGIDSILFEGKQTRIMSTQNIQEAMLYGLNWTLALELFQRWSFTHTVSYTFGQYQPDTATIPLDHVPPLYGKAVVTYSRQHSKYTFFFQYNGRKRIEAYNPNGEDNQIYATAAGLPGWYTYNFQIEWLLPSEKHQWKILTGIENILDRNYRTFSSGISAPGRNFFLTLRYNLN